MNKNLLFSLAAGAVCAFALSACGAAAPASSAPAASSGAQNTVQKIAPDEAKKMMEEGGVTVVDVSRQEEYDAGHIENAVLVPNESISNEAPAALPDKDAVLLLYCRSGRRSAEAAAKLAALGYTHVYDFGGIQDWPYDVVTEAGNA